jgi:GntR family transcriptional regulator
MMWTPIGSDSTVPIYEQIIGQVVGVVASGGLKPGELLPSVREMAGLLLVNPNTVARAYGELERAGLVESRRGTGMLITPDAPQKSAEMRVAILKDRLRPLLRDALGYGLTAPEITRLIEVELAANIALRNHPKSKSTKPESN